MSFAKTHSAQIVALKAHIVDVEVDLSRGLHHFSIVGLANKAVDEARDRISAAIKNSGFKSPKQTNRKIVVSLAPADIQKSGPHFDLSIAVGYLCAAKEISLPEAQTLFLGELSLDGKIRSITGTLPLVIIAKESGFKHIIIPQSNIHEAISIDGIFLYGVSHLREVIDHIQNIKKIIQTKTTTSPIKVPHHHGVDLRSIVGQDHAKRALEIAAAGKHSILLYGPPGTGKTLLAKALHHILPPLSNEESHEVSSLYSACGLLSDGLISIPPFREPHHTASYSTVIGSLTSGRAGEISLAHRGVLLLDEAPEFDRRVLESLRQPLENKQIRVTTPKLNSTFPADFLLIMTMNPCPCGNRSSQRTCVCPQYIIERYQNKLSGPILDRIDLKIKLDTINFKSTAQSKEGSSEVLCRVRACRKIQSKRAQQLGIKSATNSELTPDDLDHFPLSKESQKTLDHYAQKNRLSLRSYYKVIKIARTIADLEKSTDIQTAHILEALQYCHYSR